MVMSAYFGSAVKMAFDPPRSANNDFAATIELPVHFWRRGQNAHWRRRYAVNGPGALTANDRAEAILCGESRLFMLRSSGSSHFELLKLVFRFLLSLECVNIG